MERMIEGRETKDKVFQKRIGRWIGIFFACMVAFTVISRVAASLTVALVSVQTTQRGTLSYETTGTGKVEGAKEQYLDLLADMTIDEVAVKSGETVEEGDLLFTYDVDTVKEQLETLSQELKTSERSLKKSELEASKLDEDDSDTSSQQKSYTRAQEDYEDAVVKLKEVKADYKAKLTKIEEELDETKSTEYKTVLKAYEEAQEAYDDTNETYEAAYEKAVKECSDAKSTRTKAVKEAEDALTEEQDTLAELSEDKNQLINDINNLKGYAQLKDTASCATMLAMICTHYFGETDYKELLAEIAEAEVTYNEAETDYSDLVEEWAAKMTDAKSDLAAVDTSSDEYATALSAYNEIVREKNSALKAQQRIVNHAKTAITTVSTQYTEIKTAVYAYRDAIMNGKTGEGEYTNLYKLVIDDTIFDSDAYEKQVKTVAKKQSSYDEVVSEQDDLVTEAGEAVTKAKAEWDKYLTRAQNSLTEAKDDLDAQLAKVYSGDDEIATAGEEVTTQEEAVQTAKRALEDAKTTLSDAQEEQDTEQTNAAIDEQISELDILDLKDEIAKTQESIDELEKIVEADGVVTAPVGGVVTTLEIVNKTPLSGSEKVAITPDCSTFTGTITKDDLDHVTVGDTVSVKLATSDKSVDATITDILYQATEDDYSFTALLPDSDNLPGTSGTFEIQKQSDQYDQTIPISAIREENGSKYVLVMEETQTILGTEEKAVKVQVSILEKDNSTAAIEGSVSSDQQIIIGSNRSIAEGDKVRIGEYE